jgi:hypothetical protein
MKDLYKLWGAVLLSKAIHKVRFLFKLQPGQVLRAVTISTDIPNLLCLRIPRYLGEWVARSARWCTMAVRERMWFFHDGAPPHVSLVAREVLNSTYRNWWIGLCVAPALTSLESCGFLRVGTLFLVYSPPINDVETLQQLAVNGRQTTRITPGIFEHVRQSVIRRVQACIEFHRTHFQHLL